MNLTRSEYNTTTKLIK